MMSRLCTSIFDYNFPKLCLNVKHHNAILEFQTDLYRPISGVIALKKHPFSRCLTSYSMFNMHNSCRQLMSCSSFILINLAPWLKELLSYVKTCHL